MNTRRDFLGNTALGVGAIALGMQRCSTMAHADDGLESNKPQLALQLYSVRNEIEQDMEGTLEKIKSMGYDFVETAFFPKRVSIPQAGAALKNAGLEVCSIHADLPVDAQKQIWTDMAEHFDSKTMIWHGWPESGLFKEAGGIRKLAEIYNAANAFAKSNGLTFGLHNHWWEFTADSDGRIPMESLAEYLDEDIFFQLDTYWIKVAGQDPEKIVSRFADRTLSLHIKDGPAKTTRDSMLAVGSGSQDFPAVVRSSGGRVEWLIVELDKCDTDIFDALRKSREYLVDQGLVATS